MCAARADIGQTTLRYLMAMTLPIAIGATVLAEPIMHLLYGADFSAGAATLRVVVWTLVPYCWVRYHAYVLLAADRQDIDLRLNVLMTAVSVGFNLLLIPRLGGLGAAIATLTSISIYGVGQYVYLRIRLPAHAAGIAGLGTPLAAALVMGLCAWLVAAQNLIVAGVIAGVAYLAAITAMGFFGAADLRAIGLSRLAQTRWVR